MIQATCHLIECISLDLLLCPMFVKIIFRDVFAFVVFDVAHKTCRCIKRLSAANTLDVLLGLVHLWRSQ